MSDDVEEMEPDDAAAASSSSAPVTGSPPRMPAFPSRLSASPRAAASTSAHADGGDSREGGEQSEAAPAASSSKQPRKKRKTQVELLQEMANIPLPPRVADTSFQKDDTVAIEKGHNWYYQASGYTLGTAGDCAVIRAGRHLIFVDTGKGNMFEKAFAKAKKELGKCTNFIFITTHWHDDHVGNEETLRDKLKKLCPEQITPGFYTTVRPPQAAAASLSQAQAPGEKRLSLVTCKTAQPIMRQNYTTLDSKPVPGWNWTRNLPNRTLSYTAGEVDLTIYDMGNVGDVNNATSLGLRLVVNGWVLVSLGDMEKDKQTAMLNTHTPVFSAPADAIKMAHHGSSHNFVQGLLKLKSGGRLISSGHTLRWESGDVQVDSDKAPATLCLLMHTDSWTGNEETMNGYSTRQFRALCSNRQIYNDGILLDIGPSAENTPGEEHDEQDENSEEGEEEEEEEEEEESTRQELMRKKKVDQRQPAKQGSASARARLPAKRSTAPAAAASSSSSAVQDESLLEDEEDARRRAAHHAAMKQKRQDEEIEALVRQEREKTEAANKESSKADDDGAMQ